MRPGRRAVITTQLLVVALLCGQALVTVVAGGRGLPAEALWDDDERAADTVDRAFDLIIAVFAFAEAAVVLLALRSWLKSGRWTILFLCDLAIAIPAGLIVSPAGPTIGDLATTYLLVLTVSATVAGILAAHRPSKRTMTGSPGRIP